MFLRRLVYPGVHLILFLISERLPARALRLPGFTINRLPVNIQCLPLLRPLCLARFIFSCIILTIAACIAASGYTLENLLLCYSRPYIGMYLVEVSAAALTQ